jgi:type II secretory pathway component PulM
MHPPRKNKAMVLLLVLLLVLVLVLVLVLEPVCCHLDVHRDGEETKQNNAAITIPQKTIEVSYTKNSDVTGLKKKYKKFK